MTWVFRSADYNGPPPWCRGKICFKSTMGGFRQGNIGLKFHLNHAANFTCGDLVFVNYLKWICSWLRRSSKWGFNQECRKWSGIHDGWTISYGCFLGIMWLLRCSECIQPSWSMSYSGKDTLYCRKEATLSTSGFFFSAWSFYWRSRDNGFCIDLVYNDIRDG